jgi:hypothetical protein
MSVSSNRTDMRNFHQSNITSLVVAACAVVSLQASFAEDHDHEASAPPPPTSRRAHVGVEELATILNAEKDAVAPVVPPALPPLPEGVIDLSFQDFFKMPVGPRGLETTEKLRSLDGRRVRIPGYMARMERSNKRQLVFAPMPLQPQPHEYGLCDDIPATHVLVTVAGNPDEQVIYTPGPLLLTGILSVGPYSQGSETSFVRLQLDTPATK